MPHPFAHPTAAPRHAAGAVRDLRGGMRLALDGARAAIGQLEALHRELAELQPPVRGFGAGHAGRRWPPLLYRGLRGGTELVGGGLDLLLASLQAALQNPVRERGPEPPQPTREALMATLNALLGDHLARTDNPLAIALQLRPRGTPQPRVLVLAHDLGLSDLQWRHGGHDHGQALADALGCTPVYLLYNSGRHVSASGRELAAELERRLAGWPVPVQGLALLGHGLGGLVLRSALHQAVRSGLAWPAQLQKLILLGTPNLGAPAAGLHGLIHLRPGPQALLGPLARRRSEGMDDFLHGRHLARDPTDAALPLAPPWPPGAGVYAIAGTRTGGTDDGVVPAASALGHDPDPARDLQVPPAHRWVAQDTDHLGLLRSQAVLRTMRQWLSA